MARASTFTRRLHADLSEPAKPSSSSPTSRSTSDAEIGRNVPLRGRTRVGHGARVEEGSILVAPR